MNGIPDTQREKEELEVLFAELPATVSLSLSLYSIGVD